MSELRFKEGIYTLRDLLDLKYKSPLYRTGEVEDMSDGEIIDIEDINIWKDKYIDELVPKRELLKTEQRMSRDKNIEVLEEKYKDGTITKPELLELIKNMTLKDRDNKSRKYLEIRYSEFYTINIGKEKPKRVTPSEYGRFFMLLDYISYKNKIQHSANGKKVKEELLSNHLEFKTVKSFQNFISKLSKANMLCKAGHGTQRFIHINPVYAKRKVKIDQTLYDLFKDDLKEYLSEHEIRYFEMDDDDESMTPSTIELI